MRDLLPVIRGAGYGAVEVSWSRLQRDFIGSRDRAAALRAVLAENRLMLSGVNAADLAATSADELVRLGGTMRDQVRFAREMELTSVNLRSGDRKRQSPDVLVSALIVILSEAEEFDLTINLGNGYGTRIEQLEDLLWLEQRVRNPRLRLLLDAGQFHRSAVNPRDAIRAHGRHIGLVRLADQIGKRPVPLGQGEMNVPALVEHLMRVGYDGWLVVEPVVDDPCTAEASLARARVYVERLLAHAE